MPIFAVTPAIFSRFWSTYHAKWVELDFAARLLVPWQHYLFYPVMSVARFNLYIQSWLLLLSSERVHNKSLEMGALLGFAGWYGGLVWGMDAATGGNWERLGFVLVSHMLAGVLHVQICLSHFARETYSGFAYNDEGDEWFKMQVATTLNIDCPAWMDWFHGGLQFQVEHHLWPRLPRHNLRRAQMLVKAYCAKHDIPYHNLPWIEAQRQLITCLRETAARLDSGAPGAGQAGEHTGKPSSKPGTRGVKGGGTTIFEVMDAATNG
jgi:delta8-fatty-acid desaturase